MNYQFENGKIIVAIRAARAAIGWNQQEFADRMGVAKSTVARIETLEIAAKGDFAYLWLLGAHPDAQGRGLGRAALESAVSSMRARGFARCVLRTQQPRNVSLYRYLGFDEFARHTPTWTPLETIIFGRDL